MSDATPRTIYSGKFVAKEKLAKAEAELAELREENEELRERLRAIAESIVDKMALLQGETI